MGVSRVHSNTAGLARLFRTSSRGLHLSDRDNSTSRWPQKERTASPLTLPGEAEADRRGRANRTVLRKDQRRHASDPSLARAENWEEETGEVGGEEQGGDAHTRPDSPWEGSHVKVSFTPHLEGLCCFPHRCALQKCH